MAFLLDPATLAFPHPRLADEDGLLAVGADLSVERLLLAYQNGIFPWYDEDSPILWYAPRERFVISRAELRISKSMKQVMRGKKFRITHDQALKPLFKPARIPNEQGNRALGYFRKCRPLTCSCINWGMPIALKYGMAMRS